ncbi:MAG: tyrosine-type recombinase/integrase [Gammaproteobacteria bacterium]|nr:tyrosine-type recombinase/integrase [Gammaproteobacteria bacterium]
MAAAKDRARREGAASPAGTCTEDALSAYRRDGAGRGPGQVVGIKWEDSDRMSDLAAGCGNARGLRDALLIRLMSDGLMRVSEAEALDVADLALSKKKLLVTIRRSKTDQDGKGVVFRGGPDTMRLARKWLEAAGIEEGPVFRPVNKAGRVAGSRLSDRSMRDIVKQRAADAGIEGRVSGHSLRVGSAQSLRDRGATSSQLMTAGRWSRVETMAGYVREQDAAFGPMARLRYGFQPPAGRRSRSSRRGSARADRRERRWVRKELKRQRRASKKHEKGLARIARAVIVS